MERSTGGKRMRKAVVGLGVALGVGAAGAASAVATAEHPDALEVAAARADLGALYSAIWGDLAGRRAATLLPYLDHNEAVSSCLAASGMSYSPGMYVDADLGEFEKWPPGLYVGFGPFGDPTTAGWEPRVARKVAAAASLARAYAGPPGATEAPPPAQLAECQATAPAYDVGDRMPSGHGELSARLEELTSGDRDVARYVWDGYVACARDRGFEIAEPPELYIQVVNHYSDFRVAQDPRTTPAPEGAQWETAVAFERHAAAVDTACRTPSEGLALIALAPQVEEFRARYADELARAAQEWGEIRAEAATRMSVSPLSSMWSFRR